MIFSVTIIILKLLKYSKRIKGRQTAFGWRFRPHIVMCAWYSRSLQREPAENYSTKNNGCSERVTPGMDFLLGVTHSVTADLYLGGVGVGVGVKRWIPKLF